MSIWGRCSAAWSLHWWDGLYSHYGPAKMITRNVEHSSLRFERDARRPSQTAAATGIDPLDQSVM